jgi:hypothetical protein
MPNVQQLHGVRWHDQQLYGVRWYDLSNLRVYSVCWHDQQLYGVRWYDVSNLRLYTIALYIVCAVMISSCTVCAGMMLAICDCTVCAGMISSCTVCRPLSATRSSFSSSETMSNAAPHAQRQASSARPSFASNRDEAGPSRPSVPQPQAAPRIGTDYLGDVLRAHQARRMGPRPRAFSNSVSGQLGIPFNHLGGLSVIDIVNDKVGWMR